MKRMILAFVLVMFSSCVVHAQDSKKESSSKVKGDERAKEKKSDDPCSKPGVTCIDASGSDEPEDSMPAITPKGKL